MLSVPVEQLYNGLQCSVAFGSSSNINSHVPPTHSKSLKLPLHLTVPVISPALFGSSPLLRPLRPKPPVLLPKPPMTQDLPPLASIEQIISSVSCASPIIKTEITDTHPQATGSSNGSEKAGPSKSQLASSMQKDNIKPTDRSPDVSPTDGLKKMFFGDCTVGTPKKRGRKKGTKNKPKVTTGVDLESSGEFASIDKMLANADTNKFSPFLQSTESMKEDAERIGTSEDERETVEDKLLKGKRNSYSNSLQKITCPYCPRVFPWASSMQRHMLTHTGQKPYPCAKCKAYFSTKSNCERHLLRIHGVANLSLRRNGLLPQSNESDDGSQDSTDSRSDPEMLPAGNEVLDLTCGDNNKPEVPDLLENQRSSRKNSPYRAKDGEREAIDECEDDPEDDAISDKSLDLNFASKLMDFKLASSPSTARNLVQKVKKNICEICGKCFKFAATLGRHKKSHSSEIKKEVKSSEDEEKSVLVQAFQNDSSVQHVKVKDESSQESKMDELSGDWENSGKDNEESENLSEEEGSERRMSEKSDDDKEPKTDGSKGTMKTDKRKKICTVCNKRFWSLQDLTRHMRSHTGERPYKCQTCERTFTLKHSLVRHQRIHQKFKDPKNCGKGSDREDGLNQFEEDSENESMHSGTNPVSESECDSGPSLSNYSTTALCKKENTAEDHSNKSGKASTPPSSTENTCAEHQRLLGEDSIKKESG